MKTAVEYLLEELKELGALHIDGLHWSDQDDVKKSINQAKEMDKQQKIEFACQVYDLNHGKDKSFRRTAEDYYNETFRQEEQ
jgi:hypothetical protein